MISFPRALPLARFDLWIHCYRRQSGHIEELFLKMVRTHLSSSMLYIDNFAVLGIPTVHLLSRDQGEAAEVSTGDLEGEGSPGSHMYVLNDRVTVRFSIPALDMSYDLPLTSDPRHQIRSISIH